MKRTIALLLAVLTAAFVFAGCKKTDSSRPAAQNLKKVTVVLDWTPNTNHTGLYVAKAKGYYKARGLDVDIEQPPEDGALSLLASGKAQFAVSFQEEIATALTSSKPLDVVAVAALIQHNDSGIISLKSKGVTSPKKMEGMRYATWDSPTEKAILKDVITRDGGDYGKVKMVSTSVENIISALETNIDCVWGYYPQEKITCETKKVPTNYFFFKDLDPALDFYTPVLASSESFLKSDPDTAKKFLAATAQGYDFAISNPDAAADILIDSAKGLDKQITVDGQRWLKGQYKAEVKQWGYIDPQRWDRFYAWLYANKAISQKIAPGEGFTDAYLAKGY